MGHAEDFIHARGDGVNRGGATDFVIELGSELLAACDDLFALLVVGVPGVFLFGAGFLAEGRESDLRETVFDDFIARLQFILFPVAELASGFFDGLADFFDLFVREGVIVDLFPLAVFMAVILGTLGNEKMKMA